MEDDELDVLIEEPLETRAPNLFTYRKYNKQTKKFIAGTNDASPGDDPDFVTTTVALPEDNLNYIFDEELQLWRGLTSDQLIAYMEDLVSATPTQADKNEAMLIATLATMSAQENENAKQLAALSYENEQLRQAIKGEEPTENVE